VCFVLVSADLIRRRTFTRRERRHTLISAIEVSASGQSRISVHHRAQRDSIDLLTQHTIIEQVLGELSMPIIFCARRFHGELSLGYASATNPRRDFRFLLTIDKPVPMVAQRHWPCSCRTTPGGLERHRVVELEGPHRVTLTRCDHLR